MGTNYYHRTNICSCCGRYDERHIGKSSAGWQFSFHGYTRDSWSEDSFVEIRSFEQWKEVLQKGEIYNEYDKEISLDEFVAMVVRKQSETSSRARDYVYNKECNWIDSDGYSFSGYDFS